VPAHHHPAGRRPEDLPNVSLLAARLEIADMETAWLIWQIGRGGRAGAGGSSRGTLVAIIKRWAGRI
jgi:hypothetical protein